MEYDLSERQNFFLTVTLSLQCKLETKFCLLLRIDFAHAEKDEHTVGSKCVQSFENQNI